MTESKKLRSFKEANGRAGGRFDMTPPKPGKVFGGYWR